MGNNDLFLVSPSRRTDVKRVYGRCDEMHFYAHKIFSNLKGKKEGYSLFGIQWKEIIGMRMLESAWE